MLSYTGNIHTREWGLGGEGETGRVPECKAVLSVPWLRGKAGCGDWICLLEESQRGSLAAVGRLGDGLVGNTIRKRASPAGCAPVRPRPQSVNDSKLIPE